MAPSILKIYHLYRDGFRRMTVGKTLWKIIIIKLIFMFAVLKLFFFPNYLNSRFSNDFEKAEHVYQQMSGAGNKNY